MAKPQSAPLCVDGDISLSVQVTTLSKIRLGRVVGPPGAWRFEVVPSGAYALILPVSDGGPTALRAARVGDDGLLYELDAEDRASRESSVEMLLEAPKDYRVWWSCGEGLYAAALDDTRVIFEDGVLIQVQQYLFRDSAPFLSELRAVDDGDDRGAVHHTICHHLLHRHVFHEGRESPLFDVTPAPVRALFIAELVEWFVIAATRAAAKDMATLEHAAAMIHAAEKGLTDATLEHEAAELFEDADQWSVFERFREYAWRCAATGVLQRVFVESIRMHIGASDLPPGGTPEAHDGGVPAAAEGRWLDAAVFIRKASQGVRNGPAVHPYLQGVTGPTRGFVREGPVLTPAQQELLLRYFNAYRFGAALRSCTLDGTAGFGPADDYGERMAARMADFSEVKAQLYADTRALLLSEARCDRFVRAVACCYADEPTLLERYAHASACCEATWWTGLAEAERAHAPRKHLDGSFMQAEWPFWKRFKLWTKPLAEGAKGAGKLSKALKERLSAYKLGALDAQRMLDSLARLELTLEGHDVDAMRHVIRCEDAQVRINAAGDAGDVQLTLDSAKRKPGAPSTVKLRFVRRSGPSGAASAQFRPAALAGTFQVRLPAHTADLHDLQRFTAPFTALADAVNLAIALATVAGEAKTKDKLLATFDLAKNTVGLVSSFPSALVALDPSRAESALVARASSLGKALEGAAKVLGAADNAIKIYKGIEVLMRDASPAAFEARQGRAFRASVQRVNDAANVIVGAGGALELAGVALQAAGAEQVLGLSTALVAGFSTTPWGLVLCVGGALVVAGSALVFDLAQPWEARLMKLEQSLAEACPRQVHGKRFCAALRVDALRVQIATGRLA